ncbi:tumor protein p53-inducible protein 13 [Synchiropus picturatus]
MLTATVLAALWVSVGRCTISGSLDPGCDNSKLSLRRDLPGDAGLWDCPAWPEPPAQTLPSIYKVFDPEPAKKVCMDKPITYANSIPNSGAYRPVEAQSGEYLYCPPQRWLHNVHRGAVALLYHPCAPSSDRLLLSGVARTCLSHYVMTPHPQLDRTLPVALVAWGRTLELSTAASSDVCDWLETSGANNNMLSSGNQANKYKLFLIRPRPGPRRPQSKVTLRQCCEQTIQSLLAKTVKKNPSYVVNDQSEDQLQRERRASIRGKQDQSSNIGPHVESRPSDVKANLTKIAPQQVKNGPPKVGSKDGTQPEAGQSKNDGARSRKSGKKNDASKTLSEKESVGIEEREVVQSREEDSKPDSLLPRPPTSQVLSIQQGSGAKVGDKFLRNGMPRTPRTDDAFWAAAALGFLLVLLVVSVLYTRLYRHWRITPSLYWPEPCHDYDNVADVIRRRLRITKKRRQRSRRQEYVHPPSSSSSDEQL